MIGNSNAPTKNIAKTRKVNWYSNWSIDSDGDYIRGYFNMPNSQMYNYVLARYKDGRYTFFVLWDLKNNIYDYCFVDNISDDNCGSQSSYFEFNRKNYDTTRYRFKQYGDTFNICSSAGGALYQEFTEVTFI